MFERIKDFFRGEKYIMDTMKNDIPIDIKNLILDIHADMYKNNIIRIFEDRFLTKVLPLCQRAFELSEIDTNFLIMIFLTEFLFEIYFSKIGKNLTYKLTYCPSKNTFYLRTIRRKKDDTRTGKQRAWQTIIALMTLRDENNDLGYLAPKYSVQYEGSIPGSFTKEKDKQNYLFCIDLILSYSKSL